MSYIVCKYESLSFLSVVFVLIRRSTIWLIRLNFLFISKLVSYFISFKILNYMFKIVG